VKGGPPPDGSIRPNHIFAVSLPHSMLSPERAKRVVAVVQERLLTPYGLRSLAPNDPQYHGRYTGDGTSRDGAYHQGTVWPWLMGPFITAYIKVDGGSKGARMRLRSTTRSMRHCGSSKLFAPTTHTVRCKIVDCRTKFWKVFERN
jgi:glycogen debranching enzyme